MILIFYDNKFLYLLLQNPKNSQRSNIKLNCGSPCWIYTSGFVAVVSTLVNTITSLWLWNTTTITAAKLWQLALMKSTKVCRFVTIVRTVSNSIANKSFTSDLNLRRNFEKINEYLRLCQSASILRQKSLFKAYR